jgi:hypothetical protein
LEQSIATLKELVTQLLVKEDNETNSIDTELEEDKANQEYSMCEKLDDLSKNSSFSSSSNIPFKV